MTFWGNIYASLAYSASSILAGHELLPRFLVEAPDGVHTLFPMLDIIEEEQVLLFSAIRSFMIWKGATSFVFVTPNDDASLLSLIGVSRSQSVVGSQTIEYSPTRLSLCRWFGPEVVPRSYVSLLASKEVVVTAEEFKLIQIFESRGPIPNLIVGRHKRALVISECVARQQ